MQAFIILCIVGAAFAHGPEFDFTKVPGCENAAAVNNTKASTCCPALPKSFGKDEAAKNVSSFTDASGKFDATKAKAELKKVAAAWPTDSIVDKCVKDAPATIKKWEEKMAAMKNGTKGAEKNGHKKEDKKPCFENKVIGHCIRHELIVQCPTWTKSAECDALSAFAKSCPLYPFHPHGKGDKKEEQKNGKNKKH